MQRSLARLAILTAHRSNFARCLHSVPGEEESLRESISKAFKQNPEHAAELLSQALPNLEDRARIVRHMTNAGGGELSQGYTDMLFHQADKNDDGTLCKTEMASLLAAHAVLSQQQDNRMELPTTEQLARVFTSNALPFVGFGFLDNFLLITAGESIEASFGVMFSLSTMAAAGFGNMVADTFGIFATDVIRERAKVVKWGRAPSLSPFQLQLPSVRYARGLGATVGICVGCLLGMFPLLLRGHPSEHADDAPALTSAPGAA